MTMTRVRGSVVKTCNKCGESKPLDRFVQDRRYADGHRNMCLDCRRHQERGRYKATKEQYRHYRLKWYYGLSQDDVDTRLLEQDGCAVCHTWESKGRGDWHVDHDHACCPGPRSCGECVRGILCSTCNKGLGLLKDNPDLLLAAAAYLLAQARTHSVERYKKWQCPKRLTA